MTAHDRIKLVVKWLIGKGIANNQEAIGRLIGYSNKSSFSQILNNKVPIPSDFIDRLCLLDENINKVWIEKELGDMVANPIATPSKDEYSHIAVTTKADDVILHLMDKIDEKDNIIKEKDTHMGSILSRIQEIAREEKITIGTIERIIGASKGVLSRAVSNGTDIQSKWISLVVENYPRYSTDWLLTGEGPMLKGERKPMLKKDKKYPNNHLPIAHSSGSTEGIPLIPISAMAGILNGEVSVMEFECERYIVPVFKGAEFLIGVKGSSMYPKYNSGDIVACKKVPMSDMFFQWNKVYVIDTDQGALIKRILPGSDKDHVNIVSDNEKYIPFELPLSRIYAVALVIGVIRLE